MYTISQLPIAMTGDLWNIAPTAGYCRCGYRFSLLMDQFGESADPSMINQGNILGHIQLDRSVHNMAANSIYIPNWKISHLT